MRRPSALLQWSYQAYGTSWPPSSRLTTLLGWRRLVRQNGCASRGNCRSVLGTGLKVWFNETASNKAFSVSPFWVSPFLDATPERGESRNGRYAAPWPEKAHPDRRSRVMLRTDGFFCPTGGFRTVIEAPARPIRPRIQAGPPAEAQSSLTRGRERAERQPQIGAKRSTAPPDV
jgi:hypothetical protein